MGASTSSDREPSPEQKEQESLAASTVSLPFLKSAFANLSDPQSQCIPLPSLHQSHSLPALTLDPPSPPSAPGFPLFLPHLGQSAADLLFSASGKDGADWITYLRGFNRCCARMRASSSLNLVYRLFFDLCRRSGIDCDLEFDPDDADEGKVGGSLVSSDLMMFLLLCWIMQLSSRLLDREQREVVVLPDLSHLVLSALVDCGEVGDDESVWDFDALGAKKSVEVQNLNRWVLSTAPGLVGCFSQFLRGRIRAVAVSGFHLQEDANKSIPSTSGGSLTDVNSSLLTSGMLWAISLTQQNSLGEELSAASFPGRLNHMLNNLLYRSSTHGKGLSRFWSRVEGYHGPLLLLLSGESSDGKSSGRIWVIGVLTEHGFQNRDMFYGTSAYLYALCPIFRVLSPAAGKEKNFIYSHLHPTGRVYEAHPKPVGLAFGGTLGNERIFIDEDFSRVTIRHHAVDKTYQHGSLVPNQGYLPVEASLLAAEVWGLGDRTAKEQQDVFKKREDLFTEQRRKVDLKTFSSWEDSTEKMMMDMLSDPSRVRREDR